MREVKVPDFMQPFEVIVNGVKQVFPAGETVTVEDYIADIIEQSVPPKAEPAEPIVERVMWEDIGNRPFWEETVSGDTLTWDGNTEGLANLNNLYFKVSDLTISIEEASAGGEILIGGGTVPFTVENIYETEFGTWSIHVGEITLLYVFPENLEGEGEKVEKGIYFCSLGEQYVSSLKINGYNGFLATTVKRMDEKYMPILTSPNGTKFKISVGDDGSLSAAEV